MKRHSHCSSATNSHPFHLEMRHQHIFLLLCSVAANILSSTVPCFSFKNCFICSSGCVSGSAPILHETSFSLLFCNQLTSIPSRNETSAHIFTFVFCCSQYFKQHCTMLLVQELLHL